jgi:hypothetical protein
LQGGNGARASTHQGSIQLATGRVRVAAATGRVVLNGLAEQFASELSNVRSEKLMSKSAGTGGGNCRGKYGSNHWLKLR